MLPLVVRPCQRSPAHYRGGNCTARFPADAPCLAVGNVHGETTKRGLLVLLVHVRTGLTHRLDGRIEWNKMMAITPQGEAGRRDRLDRAQAVAFDTGHLHKPFDRIT